MKRNARIQDVVLSINSISLYALKMYCTHSSTMLIQSGIPKFKFKTCRSS